MKGALIVLALFLALGAGGYYFIRSQGYTLSNLPIPTPPPIPTARPAATPDAMENDEMMIEETGTITGSISFPSEGIPENLEVCAETVPTADEYCTDDHIAGETFEYGVGYMLEVPAGDYYVYAHIPGEEQKAYYSEFVTCGLTASCPSHDPIEVSVSVGETEKGVDPGDWYAPQANL